MFGYYFKRFSAYLIDIFLVSFLLALIYQTNVLKTYKEEFINLSEKYVEVITSKDAKNNDDYIYDIARFGRTRVLLDASVFFLYFVIFQKVTNGETVGKRLMRLRIIKKDGENITYKNLIILFLIVYLIIPQLFNALMFGYVSKDTYIKYQGLLPALNYFFVLISVFDMIIRKKEYTFYDKLANVLVIEEKKKAI